MYLTCRHVMATGRECQSPALKDAIYCYFHFRLRKRQHTAESAILARARAEATLAEDAEKRRIDSLILDLGLDEISDRSSLQASLCLLMTAVAENLLTNQRARPILAGLELSLKNLSVKDVSTKSATVSPHSRQL